MSEVEGWRTPRIGVVLGAGVARGWSHIGVLTELERIGLPIHAVCGASSGALVAASYAAGRLPVLKELAESMTQTRMLRFMDVSFSGGGIIEGRWILDYVRDHIGDIRIEEADVNFGAVATEYGTGHEVWFTSGSLVDAVRASIALPGLLTPVYLRGCWMLDGAISNPLPVALCRSLGAEVIIAVDTSGDAKPVEPSLLEAKTTAEPIENSSTWLSWLRGGEGKGEPSDKRPSSLEVLGDAIFNMQEFITRVRLAAEPPDVVLAPKLGEIGVMDFHKGKEAIEAGVAAVEDAKARLIALSARRSGN